MDIFDLQKRFDMLVTEAAWGKYRVSANFREAKTGTSSAVKINVQLRRT
jgi:hypothetical protein